MVSTDWGSLSDGDDRFRYEHDEITCMHTWKVLWVVFHLC
jgi:hypothetical protein